VRAGVAGVAWVHAGVAWGAPHSAGEVQGWHGVPHTACVVPHTAWGAPHSMGCPTQHVWCPQVGM